MPILSHPAFGPRTAIIYITTGALIDVWTIVWYFAFGREAADSGGLSANTRFWLWGFFLTGLTLIIVGLFLGRIGRAARKSEMPPTDAVNAEARIQTAAASNPNPVIAAQAMPAAVPAAAPNVMPAPAAPAPYAPPGTIRQ